MYPTAARMGRILVVVLAVTGVGTAGAQTTRVSVATGGGQASGGGSSEPSFSADGRFVAFESSATNLVGGDSNASPDVFVHDRALATTTRVSVGLGGAQGDNFSGRPHISASGRFVAFHALATNLVVGDTNGTMDVFVRDLSLGATARVSVSTGGGQANSPSTYPVLSADGRYIAFQSNATNLVAGDTNALSDVFVHDRLTGTTTRESVSSTGAQGDGLSIQPAISADGRFVAFSSLASSLVAGDTGGYDVFVRDRVLGTTTRVSVTAGGLQANGSSTNPSLSANGRYVAFASDATNLVAGDSNAAQDVFVFDRALATTERVSVSGAGVQANAASAEAKVSTDGRVVAFVSIANNLVAADTNGALDVFVRDRVAGTTRRASIAVGGAEASALNPPPALTGDGRYVAFVSFATNLVPGDTNSLQDVFVHDVRAYQRRRVSVMTGGGQSTGGTSIEGSVSRDGRYVVMSSSATNLVPGDTNGVTDVFVHDRATNAIARVSVATGGGEATGGPSGQGVISEDGRYVAFRSLATNLVPGDTNGLYDVFVHDRIAGTTARVSVTSVGTQATGGHSGFVALSADGRYVAFDSFATNLVAGDTNGVTDVFVHDRVTGTTSRVSVTSAGLEANGSSRTPSLSADGRVVAFTSLATNLVPGDTNAATDMFVRDLQLGTTTRVNVATGGGQANGSVNVTALSGDGRYAAFDSPATNLVPLDTNGQTDVFIHDRLTTTTTRVSVGAGGVQALGGVSQQPSLSRDGRIVAFISGASNLVPADTNGSEDVFVVDRVAGEIVRASLGPDEAQAGPGSPRRPVLSADGRVLAYDSDEVNLVAGDTNAERDVFVRAVTPVLSILSPRAGPTTGGTTLRIDGHGFAPGTTVEVGGLPALHVDSTQPTVLFATTPVNVGGMTDVSVTVPCFGVEHFPLSYTYVPPPGPSVDTDGDGLSDAYEVAYSLDPLDPADAGADPDLDGVPTLAEQAAGTHPKSLVTRYLAEGATSSFFDTTFSLVNPGEGAASVLLRFQLGGATTVSTNVLKLLPRSRLTLDAKSLSPMLATAEFSTVLESDRVVVLDRTMRWDASGYGSHTETAQPALSADWYLAEGSTVGPFDLFYLLQNPADTATVVQVTFLRPTPFPPIVKNYVLQPRSRFTVWVDFADPGLAATDVSAQIAASQPIGVERSMYLNAPGTLFAAGHESAGVTAPAESWFFAEGATGPYFDLFVLMANPSTTPANVTATFLKPDGTTIVKPFVVPGKSRSNIWVDVTDPALADTAVSTTLQVTNGVPIVAERAMWWPGNGSTWFEAHNSPGATTTGTTWAVASGEDGGMLNAETYVLIANAAAFGATARVTVLVEGGGILSKDYTIGASSRFNVPVRTEFPGAVGQRFGVLIESVGLGAAPLIVESAQYSDAGGVRWAAGSNGLATKLK